jgi:hypothetical protein
LTSGATRWRSVDIEDADAKINAADYVPRARIKSKSSKKKRRVRRAKRDRR